MKDISKLHTALLETQDMVIGLFRPRFYPQSEFIPVIENDNGNLICIEVSILLGRSTLHIGVDSGKFVPFPTEFRATDEPIQMTLTDMKKDPLWFNEWYKNNCYNPDLIRKNEWAV